MAAKILNRVNKISNVIDYLQCIQTIGKAFTSGYITFDEYNALHDAAEIKRYGKTLKELNAEV